MTIRWDRTRFRLWRRRLPVWLTSESTTFTERSVGVCLTLWTHVPASCLPTMQTPDEGGHCGTNRRRGSERLAEESESGPDADEQREQSQGADRRSEVHVRPPQRPARSRDASRRPLKSLAVCVSRYDQTSAQVKALENQAVRVSAEATDESKMADSMLKDIARLQRDIPSGLAVTAADTITAALIIPECL